MSGIQNNSGPNSFGKTSWNSGGVADGYQEIRSLIIKANTANLTDIFKFYNIQLDGFNKKCICPFPFHNENSASFNFYKDTNSFYCWGCKNGGGCVEFIALMNSIEKAEAAKQILNNFDFDENVITDGYNQIAEQNNLILEFSGTIRAFIRSNKADDKAMSYINKITFTFDKLCSKHKLDFQELKSIIQKLKVNIDEYNR